MFVFGLFGYRAEGGQHMRAHMTTAQQLTEEASKSSKPKSFEDSVPTYYHRFQDIFSKGLFDELPKRWPWDHTIKLTPGNYIVSCKIYSLSLEKQ